MASQFTSAHLERVHDLIQLIVLAVEAQEESLSSEGQPQQPLLTPISRSGIKNFILPVAGGTAAH